MREGDVDCPVYDTQDSVDERRLEKEWGDFSGPFPEPQFWSHYFLNHTAKFLRSEN